MEIKLERQGSHGLDMWTMSTDSGLYWTKAVGSLAARLNQRRFMDVVMEDIEIVGLTVEETGS